MGSQSDRDQAVISTQERAEAECSGHMGKCTSRVTRFGFLPLALEDRRSVRAHGQPQGYDWANWCAMERP
jgi:hypothetical protein